MSEQKIKIVHYEVNCGNCNKIIMVEGSLDDYNNVTHCPRCGGHPVKPTIARIVYEDVKNEK